MATIYIKNISAFDAANSQVITFGYTGNQCIKNRIIVYKNSDNSVVYDDTTTTYVLSNTIPVNTLTNGDSYYCTITAYYSINNVEYWITSSASNVFKCLTTPTWALNGLSEGSVIGNSYYDFSVTYAQTQSEAVNEYYIVLYSTSGSVYWSSEAIYDVTAITTASNLPNNTVLYARAYGTTVNGLSFDTRNASTGADISLTIDYTIPSIYSTFELENDKWKGWTKVNSNFAALEGVSDSTVVYINGKYADLISNRIIFDDNVLISGDYIIEAQAYNITPNLPFITILGMGLELILTFRQSVLSDGEKIFAELKEPNTGYVLYSNYLGVPASTDLIHVWAQRKGGYFNLTIANKGEAT